MKLGFFVLFFLLFNSYLLLMAILYLKTEKLWLLVKKKIITTQQKRFEWRIQRIKKRGELTVEDKLFFKYNLRKADRLWAFHLVEREASPRTQQLLEDVYTEGLTKRFKKVLRLPTSAQYTLISRIPNIGFMNNTIKTSLLKSLQVDDHDIRMLTLYVIINVKSKNYFLEALEYISGHHLGYNVRMLAFLMKRAEENIEELSMIDIIEDRHRLSSQVREALVMALSMYSREEREPIQPQLREWFLEESNTLVRPYFYALLDLNSLSQGHYERVEQDLKSYYEPLKLSALRYKGLHLDDAMIHYLREDLMQEKNVDIIYEEVRLLLKCKAITKEDCQLAESKHQVLRTYQWMMEEGRINICG